MTSDFQLSPVRLACTFSEGGFSQAEHGCIDWKYTLGLDLTNPGFDASVLSEFRQRPISAISRSRPTKAFEVKGSA